MSDCEEKDENSVRDRQVPKPMIAPIYRKEKIVIDVEQRKELAWLVTQRKRGETHEHQAMPA